VTRLVDPARVDFALEEMPGRELHDVLDACREVGPVAPTRFFGQPAFVISSQAALAAAFKDAERFPPHEMYRRSFEPAVGRSFISMAGREHHVYRRLATPAFRSRSIERYAREGLEALAHELLDELAGAAKVDLLPRFCARFPYLVISRMLGLPRDREAEFHGWALGLLRFREDPAAALEASRALTAFLEPVVAARRAEPREDVISELVAATVEGRALSDDEVFSHVRLLFPTGGETTHGSLGNLLYALLSNEGAWTSIVEDPERAPAAVEEGLRWETPIAVLPRLSAPFPIELEGVEIPPDSWVLFGIAGANRDPAVYPDPHRFDPAREPRPGLTFGLGPKSCPGMHLARTNLRVALQVLARRLPGLRLLDPEAARPRRTVLRSPDALRVALR